MSDRFEVKITGSNQASQAFQSVTRDIETMGRTADNTTRRMGMSFDDFNRRAFAIGAAVGSATLALGEFSRAAAEDEASQQRLQQAIENTGESYDDYSIAVERAIKSGQDKAFADDQVREALTRLNTVTGDTEASLQQMSLVMDFARARGIDLATAADVVGKVMGGNLGILSRYGIQLEENATKEQALALLQQRTAGQADAYANTALGQVDQMRIKWDELTESIGAHTGGLQEALLLLPGLSAGYSALAGAFAGLGGVGGLAKAAPFLVQGAGIGALGAIGYGYMQNDVGSTFANTLANQIFFYMSQLINAAIPGNPLDEQKYVEQMGENAQWDQIIAAFGSPQAAAQALGIQGTTTVVEGVEYIGGERVNNPDKVTYTPPTNDEIFAAIVAAAAAGNMTLAEYLASPQVRGAAVSSYYSRTGFSAQGDVYGTGAYGLASTPAAERAARYPYLSSYRAGGGSGGGLPEGAAAYMSGGMGAVAMSGIGQQPVFDEATQGIVNANMLAAGFAVSGVVDLEAYRAKLTELFGAYAGVVEGVNSANDAHVAFKATQDGILAAQGPYNQQLSEYNGVLSDMEAGYNVLQERQAAGIKLTEEEQAFLEKYPALYERVQGGVDDATVANALLAAQYAENMSKGDALNDMLASNTSETGNLVEAIELLILSLNGVPEEVQTRILVNNIDYAISSVDTFAQLLNGLPDSKTVAVYYQTYGDYVPGSVQSPFMHGGVVGYANGGIVAEMAEAGPELLRFANGGTAWAMDRGLYNVPRGTYVTPAPASRGQGRQAPGIVINGNVTVIANDARQMYDSLNEYARGGSRL